MSSTEATSEPAKPIDPTGSAKPIEESAPAFDLADVGRRVVNFLVDHLLFFLLLIPAWRLLELIRLLRVWDEGAGDGNMIVVVERLLWALVIYVLYFTLVEGMTGGRSIGKLLTRTRVIQKNGDRAGFADAFLRSLCRCIPLEVFSAVPHKPPYPWHDRLSETLVVADRSQKRDRPT